MAVGWHVAQELVPQAEGCKIVKYLVGFFLGLMVAGAVAQIPRTEGFNAVMAAGVGPDGKMSKILVDADGYVICSKR